MANKTEIRDGLYTFQLLNKITPTYVGQAPYQRKKVLKGQILSTDAETGRTRIARFIPGVKSFWMDDQEKVDAKYARTNVWSPEFYTGTLILEAPRDKEKIEYMLTRDDYDGVTAKATNEPPLYTLVNKEQEYGNTVDFLESKHKAEGLAIKADEKDMFSHATFLGIPTTEKGRARTESEIRADYIIKAGSDPALFLKTLDSPTAKVTAMVQVAIKNGVIDTSHVKNQAHWGDTKALICTLDPKKTAVNSLVDFAMSKEGKDFLNRITIK